MEVTGALRVLFLIAPSLLEKTADHKCSQLSGWAHGEARGSRSAA